VIRDSKILIHESSWLGAFSPTQAAFAQFSTLVAAPARVKSADSLSLDSPPAERRVLPRIAPATGVASAFLVVDTQ
jgi:hypothetical protein